MSQVAIDRTLNYLGLINRQYQIVDYSYLPSGAGTRKRICPSNPMRVALFIQGHAVAASNPFFLLSTTDVGFLPRVTNTADWYLTVQQHLIMPTFEIFYTDNGVIGIQSSYGIIKVAG